MTVPTVQSPENSNMQVFQSVPTHDDMMALSAQVKEAKRGQARFLIMVIFLAGVLAAAIVAMVFMYGNSNTQLSEAEARLDAQAAEMQAQDEAMAALNQTIADQKATIDNFADFQSIVLLQQQADALEADIEALLDQPSRANAPQRLKTLPEEVEWLDDVVTRLRARRDALQKLKADVEAWPPVPANPRPD